MSPKLRTTDPQKTIILEKDSFFMKVALVEAKKAFMCGEVPVGAVLVKGEKVVARGHNRVEKLQSALEHAEMRCLKQAAKKGSNWRLLRSTLYCTLEPCLMCAGALFASRVQRIVWGAPDLRMGSHGSWIDVFKINHPFHQIEIVGHVLEEESAFLMRQFFQNRRREEKKPFVKNIWGNCGGKNFKFIAAVRSSTGEKASSVCSKDWGECNGR